MIHPQQVNESFRHVPLHDDVIAGLKKTIGRIHRDGLRAHRDNVIQNRPAAAIFLPDAGAADPHQRARKTQRHQIRSVFIRAAATQHHPAHIQVDSPGNPVRSRPQQQRSANAMLIQRQLAHGLDSALDSCGRILLSRIVPQGFDAHLHRHIRNRRVSFFITGGGKIRDSIALGVRAID